MIITNNKILAIIAILISTSSPIKSTSCYPRSIFVPRQLSYNPILENSLTRNTHLETYDYIFSIKPIYTQSVGSKFQKYFTINHAGSLNVQEDGSGDISSLWFKVVSSDDTFYSSKLSFHPKRQTYGSLLYLAAQLTDNVQLSINTALVSARNNIHLCEKNIQNLGVDTGYSTITESFSNCERKFGRICGTQTKTGLDDIQVKALYTFYKNDCMAWDIYGLLGIPTGKGSKARYLFEPLVGSNHVQLGVGAQGYWQIWENECNAWSLRGEAKYRYGFEGKERRSFDLKKNGQWSRYMLFVNEFDKFSTFPAINDLTFKAYVTPRSSFDLYLATQCQHQSWNFELGYDLWYRSAEKISLPCNLARVAVADLREIAAQDPHSASTANISQGVQPGINQMVSDPTFVLVDMSNDINCKSGAQAASLSNSVYGSIGYAFDIKCHKMQVGLNVAYERGSSVNTPDNIAAWLNVDLYL
jgi:hypothetical protein